MVKKWERERIKTLFSGVSGIFEAPEVKKTQTFYMEIGYFDRESFQRDDWIW